MLDKYITQFGKCSLMLDKIITHVWKCSLILDKMIIHCALDNMIPLSTTNNLDENEETMLDELSFPLRFVAVMNVFMDEVCYCDEVSLWARRFGLVFSGIAVNFSKDNKVCGDLGVILRCFCEI